MEGQTLSHYRVLEKLGGGGMGVVYKALDTKLSRHVALKFLPPELTRDDEARERFILEAQAASALDHPNICTIHEIDETPDGQMFLAMAYYEGETLKKRLERGPLPIGDAFDIAVQVAQGLAKAHEANIVHRDIKPANLIVTTDGFVKIVDFGIAKLLGVTGPTQTGTTLGTVSYMSPEQVAGEDADPQSDVWPLGAVLYEMLTGRQAFRGENQWAVMDAIRSRAPESPSAVRSDLPREAEQIVLRALDKSKDRRYASAMAFLEDARPFHADLSRPVTAASPAVELLRGSFAPKLALGALLLVLTSGLGMFWSWNRGADTRWAREEAVPEVMRLIEADAYFAAFELAEEAARHVPDDPILQDLWPQMTAVGSLRVEPPQTDVYFKPYDATDDEWRYIGQTPLENARLPRGVFQWRLEKDGFEPRVLAATNPSPLLENMRGGSSLEIELREEDDGMVQVPGGAFPVPIAGASLDAVALESFYVGRLEVTNEEFQEFVDQGGYENPELWEDLTFARNGEELPWDQAVAEFVDATGEPGPSTWELGGFPPGEGSLPVGGVSWFEASAYARFRAKHLPTAFHWARAALSPVEIVSPLNGAILPHSNFDGEGPARGGVYQGIGPYGTLDMAGNVREWSSNEIAGDRERRVMLGGGWNDPEYMFTLIDPVPAFDRSPSNGIRLAEYMGDEPLSVEVSGPFDSYAGQLSDAEVVSDEVFQVFVRQAAYIRGPLQADIEATDESSEFWVRQRVSFDAASDGSRLAAQLFLPRQGEPPYQPVVVFPGIGYFMRPGSSDDFGLTGPQPGLDFLVRDGRAVILPVYRGSFERWEGTNADLTRERTMAWREDLGRTIDYLETRDDMDTVKLAYFGASYGAYAALPLLALEERLQVAVLRSGGLLHVADIPPEAHPVNYVPRTTIPVLMLNGRYDYIFPLEASQNPLFERLGTAPADKHRVLFDAGHFPLPRNGIIRETLAWLDEYLGPAS